MDEYFLALESKEKPVHKNIKLRIFDESLIVYGKSLLSILLKDRTTGRNIIWATNDYLQLGEIYREKNEISLDIINGKTEKFIRPRITKSFERQSDRTKEKAEVFTPSWVCNKQNNLIDEAWFGYENVFNKHLNKNWETNREKIIFPDKKNKTWKKYIDARRLEITCGEAPYITSRYDTVTGETIALDTRIGLLDRKLRVVYENTDTEEDWLKWTERAFQSVYAFEFQGDNLLLARENLLHTFIDNVRGHLNREPSLKELKRIATIISWNIWQMDGLTFAVPLSKETEKYRQLSIFENVDKSNDFMEKPINRFCKVKNWRSNITLEYRCLSKGGAL